jgi:hypothetical protein
MAKGNVVLLVPSQKTAAGIRQLEEQLKRSGVEVHGNQGGLVFAQWNDKARRAIPGNRQVKAQYLDKISSTDLEQLSPPAKRLATVWNWQIDNTGKKVTDAGMRQLLKSLEYEERHGEIYDLLTNKSVGKIERKEEKAAEGNWTLGQTRKKEWIILTGFTLIKLTCISSATPTICTQIIAEINGSKHYAYSSRNSASSVSAESSWSAVWWWEHWTPASAFSWGVADGVPHLILKFWQ